MTGGGVGGGLVYRNGVLRGRFWADKGGLATADLVAASCTADLIDEAGTTTPMVVTADLADARYVIASLEVELSVQAYLVVVSLTDAAAGTQGPRAFPLGVA